MYNNSLTAMKINLWLYAIKATLDIVMFLWEKMICLLGILYGLYLRFKLTGCCHKLVPVVGGNSVHMHG